MENFSTDLGATFNANEMPQAQSGLQPGKYNVVISDAVVKPTQAGNGKYVNIKLTVSGPTSVGGVTYDMFNIHNPNPKAVEIGMAKFRQLLDSLGIGQIRDTSILNNKVVGITVAVDSKDPSKTVVKKYEPATGGIPTPTNTQAPKTTTPPWGSK